MSFLGKLNIYIYIYIYARNLGWPKTGREIKVEKETKRIQLYKYVTGGEINMGAIDF